MIRPIRIPVTVIEDGEERPAHAGEVKVDIGWGSAPWQKLHAVTGYVTTKGGTLADPVLTRHEEGDHIAIWARNPGEKGFGAEWYHIEGLLKGNEDIRSLENLVLVHDDASNTYFVRPW